MIRLCQKGFQLDLEMLLIAPLKYKIVLPPMVRTSSNVREAAFFPYWQMRQEMLVTVYFHKVYVQVTLNDFSIQEYFLTYVHPQSLQTHYKSMG